MEPLDYWRLCDELSVVQAALLIVGEDPSRFQEQIDHMDEQSRPVGYGAAKFALTNAIKNQQLPANIVGYYDDPSDPSWHLTVITFEDVRVWLRSRGIKTGFFFPEPQDSEPDYLSTFHDHYSQKLAGAIQAWTAVSTDPTLRAGKTVKQALVVWLRQHANEFGLTKEDGNPNEQGIEEVAKIANWDTKGGAPRTPY
jgi:hypothetical protein